MEPITNSAELLCAHLAWRGIESPCGTCGGSGMVAYGSTATWHGGVGGASITNGVCDKCWGSGDADQPWPSHRRFEAQADTIERLQKLLRDQKAFSDGLQAACDSLRKERDELKAKFMSLTEFRDKWLAKWRKERGKTE